MDPLDVVALTRRLVDVESTTGDEAAVCVMVGEELERRGYAVTRQTVTGERVNLLATVGTPEVILSTHMDCVPPFTPSRVEGDRIHGRGSCDAKGILVSQVAASEAMRAAGETRVGLLFLVGEERGSDGAMIADELSTGVTRFLVNGEPTEGRLALGHRGVVRVKLHAKGRAAHSGYPQLGESAIEKLLDVLHDLRGGDWPADEVLGRTHYTVGLISGGVAPNVIPPQAEAEVFFRTVGAHDALRRTLAAVVAGRVEVHEILELPEVRLHTVPGFATEVFAYFSDVPFLTNWGTPLLLGPGTIHVAHTDREQIAIADLERAVDLYADLASRLLRS